MAAMQDYLAEERGSGALIAIAAANTMATIVVAARVLTRWKLDRRFGLDDGLICNAQVRFPRRRGGIRPLCLPSPKPKPDRPIDRSTTRRRGFLLCFPAL